MERGEAREKRGGRGDGHERDGRRKRVRGNRSERGSGLEEGSGIEREREKRGRKMEARGMGDCVRRTGRGGRETKRKDEKVGR